MHAVARNGSISGLVLMLFAPLGRLRATAAVVGPHQSVPSGLVKLSRRDFHATGGTAGRAAGTPRPCFDQVPVKRSAAGGGASIACAPARALARRGLHASNEPLTARVGLREAQEVQ